MKKKILAALLAVTMTLSMIACGGSSEPEEETKVEDKVEESENSEVEDIDESEENTDETSAESTISIDIEKCINDLKAGLPLEPDYTFVKDYYIGADGNDLTISIVVDDSTDPYAALDFADTVVRQLNLYANMQDSSIALGNKDYYGDLYKYYTALVGVAPASQTQNQDAWFVYDAISGGKTMLDLNKQYQ